MKLGFMTTTPPQKWHGPSCLSGHSEEVERGEEVGTLQSRGVGHFEPFLSLVPLGNHSTAILPNILMSGTDCNTV